MSIPQPIEDGSVEAAPRHIPAKPLVLYRFFDAEDTLLYVGITNSPRTRFNNHRSDKSWFRHVVRSTMEHFGTREALEAAEIRAIQEEKPKHNIMHSVVSPPNQINVGPRAVRCGSADANSFRRTDAIACDKPTEADREARLDELEHQLAHAAPLLPRTPCPSCDLILLVREHDGLIKCLNCLNMWTLEEMAK